MRGEVMLDFKFENVLANFCSPVLLKRKISNLVSISKKELPNITLLIKDYNKKFERLGIKMEAVCECDKRVLLLVYRQNMMKRHLQNKFVAQILSNYGYENFQSLEEYISHLSSRFDGDSFPHEIGIFLGYPLSDVIGFIKHKGKNYKCCGYWKAYQNAEAAEKTFALYDDLKNFTVTSLQEGRSLEEIVYSFERQKIVA